MLPGLNIEDSTLFLFKNALLCSISKNDMLSCSEDVSMEYGYHIETGVLSYGHNFQLN